MAERTQTIIICFADGTLIDAPWGTRQIETLNSGDWVSLSNKPAQKIRWIGHTCVSRGNLQVHPLLPHSLSGT
ncbi:MAG: Hint domain-containing protein [Halocynthiibacter sp.]